MGEKDFYEYHRDTYQVHGVDWTLEKARVVLDTWRRQFTEVRGLYLLISDFNRQNSYHGFSVVTGTPGIPIK
jgi:hypothetical protein